MLTRLRCLVICPDGLKRELVSFTSELPLHGFCHRIVALLFAIGSSIGIVDVRGERQGLAPIGHRAIWVETGRFLRKTETPRSD